MINVVVIALLQVAAARTAAVPFGVGETFEYEASAKLVIRVGVGSGTLSVAGVDTINGHPVWRFSFKSETGAMGFHNKSDFTSWTGINDFISKRLVKHIRENNYSKDEDYAIHGDSGFYRNQHDGQTTPTPVNALDDVAFFYYIRTVPLAVGKPDTFRNFFRKDRNPVIINVLGKEECELPGNVKAQCFVLNPIVEDEPNGMFMKKKNARLWITDDARRIPVMIRTDLGMISPTFKLKKMTLAK